MKNKQNACKWFATCVYKGFKTVSNSPCFYINQLNYVMIVFFKEIIRTVAAMNKVFNKRKNVYLFQNLNKCKTIFVK